MNNRIKAYLFILWIVCQITMNQINAHPSRFQLTDTLFYAEDDDEYNLILASYKGDYMMVEKLISKGINPNAILDQSVSPLVFAAQGGQTKICAYLIANGADVNLRPVYGPTPLIAAIKANQSATTDFLISMGADINANDELGRTPIMYAVANNDTILVNKLLQLKCNIHHSDTLGVNVLMVAVIHQLPDMVKKIISLGVNPNNSDKYGVTPFMLAASYTNYEIMDILIDAGADMNHVSRKKNSALTIALEKQDEKLIQYLVDKGVNVNQPHGFSVTPLSIAKYFNSNVFILESLTSKGARQSYLPNIKEVSVGPEFFWNFNHIMAGISFGLKDFRYDSELTFGFLARLAASRVLVPINQLPNQYYQYWEYRYAIYGRLTKNFMLAYKPLVYRQGIFISIRPTMSYNSFRGTSIQNQWKWYFSPEAGIYHAYRWVQFNMAYQYLDFGYKGVSPHHISVGVKFYMGKSVHFNSKNYQPWQ